MDPIMIEHGVYSAGCLVAVLIMSGLLKHIARKTQEKQRINKTRYYVIKRLISMFSTLTFIVLMIFIWGINVKNLWVSLTGILTLMAVAFFAVWSLISNIIAGVILYFTTPFKINDVIEIMPDGVNGKVLAINTFYTVIVDEEQNTTSIPNALFFQKYIKRFKKTSRK